MKKNTKKRTPLEKLVKTSSKPGKGKKICPQCNHIIAAQLRQCPRCAQSFGNKPKSSKKPQPQPATVSIEEVGKRLKDVVEELRKVGSLAEVKEKVATVERLTAELAPLGGIIAARRVVTVVESLQEVVRAGAGFSPKKDETPC